MVINERRNTLTVVTYAQVTFTTLFTVHFSFFADSIVESADFRFPSSEKDKLAFTRVGRRDLVDTTGDKSEFGSGMVSRSGGVVLTIEDDFSSDAMISSDSNDVFSCEPIVPEQGVVCWFLLRYAESPIFPWSELLWHITGRSCATINITCETNSGLSRG